MNINYRGHELNIQYTHNASSVFWLTVCIDGKLTLNSKQYVLAQPLHCLLPTFHAQIVTLSWMHPFIKVSWGGAYDMNVDLSTILSWVEQLADGSMRIHDENLPRYCIFRDEPGTYSYLRVQHDLAPIGGHGLYTGWDVRGDEKRAEMVCVILDDLSDALAVSNFIKLMGLEK